MIPDATELRVFVYGQLIDHGAMPSLADIARRFSIAEADGRDAVRSAGLGKTLLPDPRTGEIWMAGPFSARPTTYRVRSGSRLWWANCAWDMLGIAAMVRHPVEVEALCTDCGEPMAMRVNPDDDLAVDAIVHFLIPARRWYDDIGFT